MKKLVVILVAVMCLAMVGCSEKSTSRKSHKKNHKDREKTAVTELVSTSKSIDEGYTEKSFEEEGIYSISLSDNETNDSIRIDFEEKTLTINDENYELTDEQNEEILTYMTDFSIAVKAKDDDYWPHSDEYPDMFVLFRYSVNHQRWDGALCYPDNWTEMLDYLKGFAVQN
ncbi:MAG: hypothetical protein MJ093_03165 [Saccharofermentans sp.]|nr:hypothetical protein [Saccharofermentans sp.]